MVTEPFLTVGKDESGQFLSIDTQVSGRGGLVCPFCNRPLVAVRGQVRIHHFRHEGATCRESKKPTSLIPGWDHFHLALPGKIVIELLKQFDREYHASFNVRNVAGMFRKLEDYGLIQNGYSRYELTDTAMVVPGLLSLSKFDPWIRHRLQARLREKQDLIAVGQIHPAHYEVEAARQEQILSASLYLMELTTDDGFKIYKIGRTRRATEQRLVEVIRDVAAAQQMTVKGKLLKVIQCAGHVEKYLLWKYRTMAFQIARFQEFLALDSGDARRFKAEMTRFENSRRAPTVEESVIISGAWRTRKDGKDLTIPAAVGDEA